MSRPTAISPEEQEQIARKIGVLLLQGAPEDWQEITVEFRATGEYHDLLGEVTAQDGNARSLEPPTELKEIFESLREGMYRPDVGTWLSALYVVERPSSYRIDINFDTEPGWQRPLPRAAYVDELRRYPRAEENIPDWMRERIDGNAPAPVNDVPVEPPVAEEPVAEPPAIADDEPAGFQVASSFDDYDEQGRPVVADREPVPAEDIAQLRQYLENAPVVLAAREDEEDQLDPERPTVVPSTWHTDGAWLWPGAIAFYLAQYGVPPESEFVAHIRRRGFQLVEVDDATRDAAVSELLDQPTDADDDPQDYADEPQSPIADAPAFAAEPDEEPSYADEPRGFADEPQGYAEDPQDYADESQDYAEPEAAEAEPAGGSRHVLADEDELPDTGEVLGTLHDRLTEFQVDGDVYRIGSHSENARCLIEDGPDWVVTTGTGRGEDVRFARVDDAAAYLLGSLLLERRPAEPELAPEAELPQRAPEPDLPQRTPEADLPQRAPEAGLPQRTPEPELPQDLPQRTPEPALPQRAPEAELPQRAPEPDLPQRTPEADLPQRAPEAGLPQRTPGSDLPQRPAPEPERAPEPMAANPLFTANQAPEAPSAPPEPPVPHDAAPPAAQPQEEATRLQQPPQLDRPAPPAAPPSPPVGQPVQQPPVSGPGGVPPLPKRQPRRESGAPAQQQGAPGPVGGAERRPGPGGPGMAGPHRQGPPPGPPRPPQAGGQQQGGQPGGQQQGGQQIQPLNGEPPLTLYRDRRVIMLQPGTELDRFGEPNGNVLYAMRTPYTHRSLPPQWSNRSYFAYRIQRPVQALRGTAVPWFEQPGGGTAFVLPAPVSDLLADGTLAEMPATERPPME